MRFVLKRLALFVMALFGLSVVVFAALRILPGDVASVMAGVNSPPERDPATRTTRSESAIDCTILRLDECAGPW